MLDVVLPVCFLIFVAGLPRADFVESDVLVPSAVTALVVDVESEVLLSFVVNVSAIGFDLNYFGVTPLVAFVFGKDDSVYGELSLVYFFGVGFVF